MYIFYFSFRKKNFSCENFFQKKILLREVEEARLRIQIELQGGNEWLCPPFPCLNFTQYVRNVNINIVYRRNEWKRRRIEHSRSNVRHARGVEWLLACRDPAKTGREFEARRGNKVEGETFRTNTDPIERGQDLVRPRHFNPCIGACNLESVPYLVLDWLTLKNSTII